MRAEISSSSTTMPSLVKRRRLVCSVPWSHKLPRIRGGQQHFVRRDELKIAWEILTPLLHRIDNGELKLLPYKSGNRGPVEADELLSRAGYVKTDGYIWIPPSL